MAAQGPEAIDKWVEDFNELRAYGAERARAVEAGEVPQAPWTPEDQARIESVVRDDLAELAANDPQGSHDIQTFIENDAHGEV